MKNMIRMGLLAGAVATSVSVQAQTSWTDNITLGGDLRVRYNRTFTDNTAATTVNNQQIRARLTASAKVNDAMTANFRLRTGGSNVTSNDTFANPAAPANTANVSTFDLDLAYGDWRVMQGLVLSFGKAPNPFWQAGKNEVLWDADLAFDGVTAKWAADMGMAKPFANLSYNWIERNEAAGVTGVTNTMQTGLQAGASMGFGDLMNGTLAVAYHSLNNGNTNIGQNYWLFNVGAELGLNMVEALPISVYGDWIENQGSRDKKEKTAYIAGLTAGQFNNVGSWQAWYNFREVGSQSVIGGLNDSEFAAGGVDHSGHQVGAGYMAWDNTTVGLNYMNARVANNTTNLANHYERWMADLVWKF